MKNIIGVLVLFLFYNNILAQEKTKTNPKLQTQIEQYRYYKSLFANLTGKPYMPFKITSLDGRELTNKSFKGKVTLLNFWFEGCGACHTEIEELNMLYDKLKDNSNFEMAAVTFDKKESIPDFVKKFHMLYPIAFTNENTSRKLEYDAGYPLTIILDKDGNVAMIVQIISETKSMYHTSIVPVYAKIKSLL